MYREEEINLLSVTTPPLKMEKNIMSLLYVSEHSECFLKPVKAQQERDCVLFLHHCVSWANMKDDFS